MSNLVNSVTCAEILTKKLNRSVKREFISKLAIQGKIPYSTVKGRKMYDVDLVAKHLPAPRMQSFNSIKNKTTNHSTNLTQLDIIEQVGTEIGIDFQINKFSWTNKDLNYQDRMATHVPIPNVTVDDVRQYLQKDLNENLIKNTIVDLNLEKYYALSEFFTNLVYKANQEDVQLQYKHLKFIYKTILEEFYGANFIADYLEDDTIEHFSKEDTYESLVGDKREDDFALLTQKLQEKGISLEEFQNMPYE